MKAKLALAMAVMAALLGTAVATPDRAHACSCAAPPTVREELSRKTAIFAGTVTKIVKPDKPVIDSAVDLVEASFKVDRIWKGELADQATVYTAISSASCGYEGFRVGERFLVSAYGSPDRLETGYCEMTKPAEAAAAELSELGAGREPIAKRDENAAFDGGAAKTIGAWFAVSLAASGLYWWIGRRRRSR